MSLLKKMLRRKKPHRPGRKLGDIVAFHEFRVLYFAIPKVANSSLKAASVDILADQIDPTLVNQEWKPSIFRSPEGRKYLRDHSVLLDKSTVGPYLQYWKFAFVRNPWDRLVSCYNEKIRASDINNDSFENGVSKILKPYGNTFYAGMAFDDFANAVCDIPDEESDSHFRSQWSFVESEQGETLVDFIGKLESLHDDFSTIKKQCKFPLTINVPHLLKSRDNDYRNYYSRTLAKKIHERYERDVINFDYRF